MPALTKVALATALAFPLIGGATALAQSTASIQGHTTYVSLTIRADPDGPGEVQVLDGRIPCKAPTSERLWRALQGRPACKHDGYAYAYPQGQVPPWEGQVEWVNDTQHVTPDGELYHVAEIVYTSLKEGPDGGIERVHAMASELHPEDRSETDTGATYAVPVRGKLLEASQGQLTVDVGPAPEPTPNGPG